MGSLEYRLSRLEQRLENIPDPSNHKREAEKQRLWARVIEAYERGDQEPPDSDPESLAFWRTIVKYAPVMHDLYQQGILLKPTKANKA